MIKIIKALTSWIWGRKSRLERLIDRPVGDEEIKTTILPSTVRDWVRQCEEVERAKGYIKREVPNNLICMFFILDTLPLTHVLVKCGKVISEVLIQGGPVAVEDEITGMIHRSLEKQEEARKESNV